MEQNTQTVSPFSNTSRNTWVKEHLTSALLELLEQKPIAEISISELCEKAQVGRSSFYRNYQDKEDIVRQYLQKLTSQWAKRLKIQPGPSAREIIQALFSHFDSHRDLYGLLNRQGLIYLLKDIFLEIFGFNPQQELSAAYSSAYLAYFLYGWVEVWFARGMKDTPEELIAHLSG